MPAITTNDLKNGITLELDNGLFTVVEFQHVKPGKGGAFVRTKLRNLRNGNVFEKTFNAGIRVEQAILDKRDMQFLYKDGDDFVFMDTESYDQMNISPIALGDASDYLVESATAIIALHNGEIVTVEIPASAELVIADTEPGLQGDRVSGARKPATLETGKVIQVPLFVNVGDKVKVDTRTGDYVTRVWWRETQSHFAPATKEQMPANKRSFCCTNLNNVQCLLSIF
jgi:elongation factor P